MNMLYYSGKSYFLYIFYSSLCNDMQTFLLESLLAIKYFDAIVSGIFKNFPFLT